MTKVSTSTVAYTYVASGTRKVEPAPESVPVPMDARDTDLSRLNAQNTAVEYNQTLFLYNNGKPVKVSPALGAMVYAKA